MVYRYMLAPGLSIEECRSRAITWCTGCKNSNAGKDVWDVAGSAPNSGLADCAGSYFGGAPADCTDEIGTTTAQSWCGAFIPTG